MKEETKWIWYSAGVWDWCDKTDIPLWGESKLEVPAEWSRKQVTDYLRVMGVIR